ncbi:MAG: zinc-dependent metalloprotease family protein, partial [Pseudolysinimonas sp.]
MSAAIAAVALAVALLVPAGPAFAEDPTPEPAATSPAETPIPDPEPSATPTSDPTPTPGTTQIPEPVETPEPTATSTPTPTPTLTSTPTSTPSGYTDPTVLYTGVIGEFAADGQAGFDPDVQVLNVAGFGLLLVDVSGVDLSELRLGTLRLSLGVPEGLALSADPAVRFDQLATYGSSAAPLAALTATPGKQLAIDDTSGMVVQTPNSPGTHQVYAVLVTPSNGARDAVNQTQASVQTAIAHASNYWSAQSGGSISFNLAGTTSWYASANPCTTSAGSTALWNEAIDVARTQLGYTPAKNTHLVLFFPASMNCGGAIGLGTIGWSVNQGGLAWVIGSGSALAQQTTSHELGHNLSLGHADWADCNTADPHPGYLGTTGCAIREYGDITDVMGYGSSGRDGGALSSAQAVRASIWPESAWVQATTGIHSYTLTSVSSHAGSRTVVVQDTDGVNYFVEFRNFTGEDSQYNRFGCMASACVANATGVRILRIEHSGWQGLPGDDSYLIGRIVGGVKRLSYAVGETFRSTAGGIEVTVTAMTSTTATVSITVSEHNPTAPDSGGAPDAVDIAPVVRHDNQMRVGDTWSVFLGDRWTSDNYIVSWLRDDFAFTGRDENIGSGFTYTIQPGDLGHRIRAQVYGIAVGGSTYTFSPYYGTVRPPGYMTSDPGSVAVANTTSTLYADMTGWPGGTTFTCKWIRETTPPFMAAVADATNCASYPLTVGDRDRDIAVQVTAIVPYVAGGTYAPVMRQSPARDYSITYGTAGTVTVAGTPQVGVPATVSNTNRYTSVDGPITPGFTYTWFRNGVAILGASGPSFSSYTPVFADVNTKLSV